MLEVQIYRARDAGLAEWRWRALAANGENIASGEGYINRSDCIHGVCLVMHIDESTVPVPLRGGFKFEVEE